MRLRISILSLILFCFVFHLRLTCAVPSTFPPLQLNNVEGDFPVNDFISSRQLQRHNMNQNGFVYPETLFREVLLVNGTSDDSFTVSFQLEDGLPAKDLEFSIVSNNTEIVNPETDVSISQIQFNKMYNVTTAIDFNKFPGLVRLTLQAKSLSNETLIDSIDMEYLAAGLAIYDKDSRTLISGAGRSLTIASYEDIYKKRHWEFGTFVQYLNKTNSIDVLKHSNPEPNFSLSDLTNSFEEYKGQILWDENLCTASDGTWDGNAVSLRPGCGMGFAVGYVNDSFFDGFHFAYDFESNRAGRLVSVFEWEDFTIGTDFEDEEYTNYVVVDIQGQPPSVVTSIGPENPFDQNGGEEVYVEMFNTDDVNITSFNVKGVPFYAIPGSKKIFSGPTEFYESIRFLTTPGKGKRLTWTISATRENSSPEGLPSSSIVQFTDETDFLFSYDGEDIFVKGMIPNSVHEQGGETVTLEGNFSSFDATNPNHGVLVGNVPIKASTITLASSSNIEFTSPPRYEIGSGWNYGVVVRIDYSFSQPLRLQFQPSYIRTRPQVFGGSTNPDTGIISVSSCGNTTFMTTIENSNSATTKFSWKLLNPSNFDLLSLPNASTLISSESVLELPNEFIPTFNEVYKVVVKISLANLTASEIFQVERLETIVVGVTLLQPENRTISSPAVSMRVIAKIEVPDCYPNKTSLTYEWGYEDKMKTILAAERNGIYPLSVHDANLNPELDKYMFSLQNSTKTDSEEITPTRLGRELIIPRKKLQHGIHRILLTVRSENDSRLLGVAGTSVSILEGELVPKIGTGQVSRRASDAENLFVSGRASLDPDIISGIPSSGLSYEWQCIFSLHYNLSFAKNCSNSLLPENVRNAASFTVTSEVLKNHTSLALDDVEGEVYVQYTLIIRKGARFGKTSQRIALVAANGLKLAGYERVELLSSIGERLDHEAVRFWEEVIIRPIPSGNTEWRFRVEKPISERSTFFASSTKLITTPGYYTVAGRSDPGFQRRPLGIKADQLSPHQEYSFSVTLQEPGKISDEVLVNFHTVEVPKLIFPAIPYSNGTTSSVFRASATTSFQTNSSFAFQFYLLDTVGSTREYCVDGCTGANTVRFQVAKPGIYVLQCRLLSASGKKLLSVLNNTAIFSISSVASVSQVDNFDSEMEHEFMLGDDGAVNQKSFFVTQSMHEQDGKVVAMSDDPGDDSCATYTRKWVNMSRTIVNHEMPNTANARNYVSLASNFARLRCVEEAETLYGLLGMVDESISRTPSEETLTTDAYKGSTNVPNVQLEEELLRFYNFSMTRALSHVAAGSSRGRLVPTDGKVDNLILDLSEMWMRHITTSATSGRVCGWDATYTSSSVDGEPDASLTPSRPQPPLGVNTIRVAVMCNREQGTSISSPFASFEWCETVYTYSSTERMLVTLAEFFDYPYISGVQGRNRSDSRRLVMVDITTLGKSNKLVSAMSDSAVFAQAESNEDESGDSCYRIRLTMGTEAMTRSDECSQNVPFHMWPRKSYGEALNSPFQSGAYQRRTVGVRVTPETRNDSATVVAQSNILGLYGAYRTTCGVSSGLGTFVGLGLGLGGILLGIMVTVIILTGLTYTLVSNFVAAAVSEDGDEMMLENYVERDFFGRGQVRLTLTKSDEEESYASSDRSGAEARFDEELDAPLEETDSFREIEERAVDSTSPDASRDSQLTQVKEQHQ